MDYIIVALLVLLSGMFSGLTLGLLSLDKSDLERKISLGNKDAKKVYSVRKRGNLLLCTLLLGNVGVNSAIAIFLGDLTSGMIGGLVATGLIVIFGEIIPQATFSRYALQVGARTVWMVRFFMIILYPVCWPIAAILNKTLGEEIPTVYSKGELMKIVEQHEGSLASDVDADEERIIKGALSYSSKTAEYVMTPRTVVFALPLGIKLDAKTLTKIKKEGFTRIPVYKDVIDNAVGVLYAKDLITLTPGKKIDKVYKKGKALTISRDTKLDVLLNEFIKAKTHIAFVENEYQGLEGIVTLEDVVEEILRQEIVDETDHVVNLQKKARKTKTTAKSRKRKSSRKKSS